PLLGSSRPSPAGYPRPFGPCSAATSSRGFRTRFLEEGELEIDKGATERPNRDIPWARQPDLLRQRRRRDCEASGPRTPFGVHSPSLVRPRPSIPDPNLVARCWAQGASDAQSTKIDCTHHVTPGISAVRRLDAIIATRVGERGLCAERRIEDRLQYSV